MRACGGDGDGGGVANDALDRWVGTGAIDGEHSNEIGLVCTGQTKGETDG